MKVSAIKKNPNNPRQIRGEKLELLKASVGGFQKMMALRPIIIDENNVVLGGNMRLAAIKALGLKEIPDDWVKRADDLTEDEKREFIIKDNAGFGEWDWDAIANEWSDLPLSDWGLDVPGFEAVEEVGEADAEPQIDKAAELNKKWKVKSGDLWQIGEHRLMCGDSTTSKVIGDCVVTDPPYGIGVDKSMHEKGGQQYGNAAAPKRHYAATDWDTLPDAGTIKALSQVTQSIIWGGNYFDLPPARCYLVWDKENDGNQFADCELAWTNLDKPVRMIRHLWNGMLREGKEERNEHPTQKPLEVIKWCVNQTEGDVYEPFAGSGTTLVACQNLNRKCYAIEISENYCAVILERMQTAFPDIEIKRIEQAEAANG